MPLLDEIIYDRIYDTATKLSRILYQPDIRRPFIAIQLNDTAPFTFVHFFNDSIQCRDYVCENGRKQFTLFISSTNIIDVRDLLNHDQLCHVYIFCMLPEHKGFVSNYLRQVQHKVRDIFMYDRLEYELLLHGVNYCKTVADELVHDNQAISNMALRDGKRLSEALVNYFTTQMENTNNRLPEQSTT